MFSLKGLTLSNIIYSKYSFDMKYQIFLWLSLKQTHSHDTYFLLKNINGIKKSILFYVLVIKRFSYLFDCVDNIGIFLP